MSDAVIKVLGITKEYRLGAFGAGTLKGDVQSALARLKGRDDPNIKIGKEDFYKSNKKFTALSNISFEVKRGETLGIIGRNGAGKSTLLKILSRVTTPTEGFAELHGRVAGILEVGAGFNPDLTAEENIYLNGAIMGMDKKEVSKKFDKIVEFAEIEEFVDTPIKRFSSGMIVKLAFAVAAHLDAEILVMDEALAVGDITFQQKCLTKMSEAAKEGRTVLYVSHNMNTVSQLCNRVIVLSEGKIIYDGDTKSGIGCYLENAASMYQPVRVFSNYDKNPAKKAKLTDLKVLNKEVCVFEPDEPLNFEIGWESYTDEELSFRVVLRNMMDNNPVASSLFFNLPKGKGTHRKAFRLNINQVTSGCYRMALVIFAKNDFGQSKNYDYVAYGCNFEKKEEKDLIWRHGQNDNWGGIRLPDMQEL